MIAPILAVVTSFISIFLQPEWVNGKLFGLDGYMQDLWRLVANIVAFLFAFILIAIAFMNIIGRGEGNWELKQALPRFIVGLLIVPFTWFLTGLILSISAILTVAVLTLPYEVFEGRLDVDTAKSEILNEEICPHHIIYLQPEIATPAMTQGQIDRIEANK